MPGVTRVLREGAWIAINPAELVEGMYLGYLP